MSFKKLIAAVAFVVAASVTPAQASFTFLGAVQPGDSGTVIESSSGPNTSIFAGILPANMRIDFSYSLRGTGILSLTQQGFYSYVSGGSSYSGYSFMAPGINTSSNVVNGNEVSTNLVLLAGSVGNDTKSKFSSIANVGSGPANFVISLLSILGVDAKALVISYKVSAIPLPAMAPLFGIALAGLAFAGRRKAKAAKA